MTRKPNLTRAIARGVRSIGISSHGTEGVAELRRQADESRAQRDWARDAYFRRRICALEPERRGAWIQYGHALKEAGFHAKAVEVYTHALSMKLDDADLVLQLAHLAKIRCDYTEAERRFAEALSLGSPKSEEIAFEQKLLRRIDNGSVFWGGSIDDNAPLRVFLSAPGAPVSEASKEAAAVGLGSADYSYSFAMRGFLQALSEMEVDHEVVNNPEYVADIRDRSGAAINIHIGFYPPERMRVLKGAYNINCFAWEFDRLRHPEEAGSNHAFSDQAAMLSIADEIWIPSRHGVEAVASSVACPVTRVPAPILSNHTKAPRSAEPTKWEIARALRDLGAVNWEPLAVLPRIQSTIEAMARSKGGPIQSLLSMSNVEAPRFYLSVFNVHDYRKQIEPMLGGFLKFLESDPNAILLLKMSTPHREKRIQNRLLLEEQIADASRMVQAMVSERVWLTDAVLTRDELNRLYDISSYYLCTSYAEGQNLPLLEAMARGVVPISVDHTAMHDYISDNNAVVVASSARNLDVRMASRYRMYETATNYVDHSAVLAALAASANLSPDAYQHKSAAAYAEVQHQFGLPVFAEKFNQVVDKLKSEGRA